MIDIKEFQEFINQFKKTPGTYTEEEQLQIGVKFKELPVKDRNWDSLLTILGSNLTKDALRSRVNRYIKKHPEVYSATTEGEVFKNDYIEQQKVRDWYNAYRRDIREEIRIQNLKDELIKAADKFKDLPQIKFPDKIKNEDKKEAVLLFSDLHLGVDCDNYYNKYNLDIAKERVSKLVSKTIDYCKNNKVQILNFINLGDSIQGIIHTNSRIETQMDVAEQIMYAGELIAEALNKLQEAAPIITYRSVFDNHSRAIANKNEHIEKEQFSRVIDWFVRERLKDSRINFFENDIDGGIGNFTLCNDKKVMFAHGHQDGRNGSFQNMIGLTREWIDYIFLAHYHNPASKDYQGCKIFINGSIVGTESYAFGRRLFTKPSQKLIIFNLHDNDIQDIDILLN